jgi:hypothetical protein
LVFKHLATGASGRNGVFGAISGQFPAKFQPVENWGCRGRGFMLTSESAKDVIKGFKKKTAVEFTMRDGLYGHKFCPFRRHG